MRRVSTSLANNDVQYNLRVQESKANKMNNQMGSQRKIQDLRDDPLAAGHLVRYQSYLARVERFEQNAKTLTDQYSVSEGYIRHSLEVMHRVRELAVAGANGIYTKEDMQNMAAEVNELLKELVTSANAVGPDGTALFAGTRTKNAAFEIELGPVPGSGDALITDVRYKGSLNQNDIEIDERAYMNLNRTGNSIFWAEEQTLFADRDASAYQVKSDSVISVDGTDIKLKAGDNVYSIISKINNSGAAVKAQLDPVTNGLNLRTTDARQLWLQDKKGSALFDLGLIKDASQRPPYNLGAAAQVSGGSLFDTVIAFRDALLRGDQESIGGRVLGGLDSGMSNLNRRIAETGAQYERAQAAISRSQTNNLNTNAMIAREGDLDITKGITDMKMLDYVKQATLSTAGKLYNTTLLNYIK
ncbi:flagellar hook-associated protein 3 [Treponema sp. HNW]|uniref:flagellar hook-associated protein 3 n=1 Tax=Treponema sp. HNW TaxID=3116654 RepID=UPI003D10C3BC